MMKKVLLAPLLSVCLLLTTNGTYFAADLNLQDNSYDVKVGGSLAFYLYDQVHYTNNGGQFGMTDSNADTSINSFWLFLSKKISETVSVHVEPLVYGQTGATPQPLTAFSAQEPTPNDGTVPGNNLGALQASNPNLYNQVQRQLDNYYNSPYIALGDNPYSQAAGVLTFKRATLDLELPWEMELSLGRMAPLLTEEYGDNLFWNEDLTASTSILSFFSGFWEDTGAELYKNFEIGDVSLPVYAYVLNGTMFMQAIHRSKAVAVHLAPQYGNLKLMVSAYSGNWDIDDLHNQTRYVAGFAYKLGKASVRAEYYTGTWDDVVFLQDMIIKNITSTGYYVKFFYNIAPRVTGIVRYDYLDNDFSGYYWPVTQVGETYSTLSPTLKINVAESTDLMITYQMGDNKMKDGSLETIYDELYIGSRVTF
ncbi:MAG: hypothetical protein ABSH12_07480 [Endomicrobiales bacterium]|jgi:hypothetical protein